jgi:hypothetical protein
MGQFTDFAPRFRMHASNSMSEFILSIAIRNQGSGLAGAFGLLLQRYPSIEAFLQRQAKQRHRAIGGAQEVRKSIKRIHKAFWRSAGRQGKAGRIPAESGNGWNTIAGQLL